MLLLMQACWQALGPSGPTAASEGGGELTSGTPASAWGGGVDASDPGGGGAESEHVLQPCAGPSAPPVPPSLPLPARGLLGVPELALEHPAQARTAAHKRV